jgi:hypothetical protein
MPFLLTIRQKLHEVDDIGITVVQGGKAESEQIRGSEVGDDIP